MIIQSLLLATALASTPASTGTDQDVDCIEPRTQLELNICAGEEYRLADAKLNTQWEATVRVMRERDMTIDKSYDKRPGYYKQLLAAQRAWLTFRDAHCTTEGYLARGGSMEPMLVATCLTTLTKLRTDQLHSQEIWPE